MTHQSYADAYQGRLAELNNQIGQESPVDADVARYLQRAFDAYIWGFSFEWLYSKAMEQAFGAGGPRQESVPLNSFYINTQTEVISSGNVAPDVAVLYANAFIDVRLGQPVVVQWPDSSEHQQFVMMQVSNSATENVLPGISTFTDPQLVDGAAVLFYFEGDDPSNYAGDFALKVPVNTNLNLLTGRVLVNPAIANVDPDRPDETAFSVEASVAIAEQFVATTYASFVQNGYSMLGLSNSGVIAQDMSDAQLAVAQRAYNAFNLVPASDDTVEQAEVYGLSFWNSLGEALLQSPLPTAGVGSEPNLSGQTPTEYLATLSDLGLSSAGWSSENLTTEQLEQLVVVANVGYAFIEDLVALAEQESGSAWSSPPADLGDFPNNLYGYLGRDVGHVANSPEAALYPSVYKDSLQQPLQGSNTYTITLQNVGGSINTPPLYSDEANGLIAQPNRDGFWAFNVYDANNNITAGIAGYANAVNSLYGYLPNVTNANTDEVNLTVSSLLLPSLNDTTRNNQLMVEENGDIVIILSPEAPRDTRYLNNWIPTPLLTYDNDVNGFPTALGSDADAFSAMLRVYTPNVSLSVDRPDAVLIDADGHEWIIPEIVLANGLANVAQISGGTIGTDAVFFNSPRADYFSGVGGFNTVIYEGKSHADFVVSINGKHPQSNSDSTDAPSEESPNEFLEDQGYSVPTDITVVDSSTDVSDRLSYIHRIGFEDGAYAFDIGLGQAAGFTARLYQVALGRDHDPEGLGYWLAQSEVSNPEGRDVIAKGFMDSNEFMTLHGSNLSNTEFLTSLYRTAFERSPDVEGFEYWMNALDAMVPREQVLTQFAESTEALVTGVGMLQTDPIFFVQTTAFP